MDPVEYGFMVFWYVVIISSVVCYAMLDGFDLGVGSLHLFAKKDEHRRIFLNAIGPVWDGNEVWLVVLIGSLFAGFPLAYATLLSAFYIPLTILIFSLIFRAIAIEFRSKQPMRWWRSMWDILFFGGSVMIAFSVGLALGNLVSGIPLDENHRYIGGAVLTFLKPYPILIGLLTVSLFMMHGAIYLVMKTEGELQEQLKRWVTSTIITFIVVYAIATMTTIIYQEHMVGRIRNNPILFAIVLANILLIANIPREEKKKRYGWAFLSSCASIALLLTLFAIGTFPDLIHSSINPEINSLTIFNASSSLKTLIVLTIIAGIGLPLVLAYGFYIYHLFRGKVKIGPMSY